MAGTFADQATLAKTNSFIDQCRAAMLFRAVQVVNTNAKVDRRDLDFARNILRSAASDAQNIAWLVATGTPAIAAASPAAPTDVDVQTAVNAFLVQLA